MLCSQINHILNDWILPYDVISLLKLHGLLSATILVTLGLVGIPGYLEIVKDVFFNTI
jgi:hypothetical protein